MRSAIMLLLLCSVLMTQARAQSTATTSYQSIDYAGATLAGAVGTAVQTHNEAAARVVKDGAEWDAAHPGTIVYTAAAGPRWAAPVTHLNQVLESAALKAAAAKVALACRLGRCPEQATGIIKTTAASTNKVAIALTHCEKCGASVSTIATETGTRIEIGNLGHNGVIKGRTGTVTSSALSSAGRLSERAAGDANYMGMSRAALKAIADGGRAVPKP